MKSPLILLSLLLALSLPQSYAQKARVKVIDAQTKQVKFKIDSLVRVFIVHVPPNYASQPNAKYPVVFMFHGGGGNGKDFFDKSGWKEVGDREGFITVFPTAYETCLIDDGRQKERNYWMTYGKLLNLCPGETPHSDVDFVKKMLSYLEERNQHHEITWKMRVGIHSGTIVAGVVGKKKFAYDLFGDTVNTASRIESAGQAGKINISSSTFELVKQEFTCLSRGKIFAKGKGELEMYFVE